MLERAEAGRERRLRGNSFGRGVPCVRSKRPHLLQSCNRFKTSSSRRPFETHQLPLTESGPTPRRCLGGPTIKALTTNGVTQFHPHIVRVDRPVGFEPRKSSIKRGPTAAKGLR
jgi:hypothetical protein